MSSLHLPTRRTKGKKPLIDYSQSHVVTNFWILRHPKEKNLMEKENVEEIKTCKKKENENMQVKQTTKLGFVVEQIAWFFLKNVLKHSSL